MAKTINVALQGGGAHGAFTWGVLDVLLHQPDLVIEGVTGTSAGAMNAAVVASHYGSGGAEAASEALEAFWREVSEAARFSPFRRTLMDRVLGNWSLDTSPFYLAYDIASRVVSPAFANPLDINPLRPLVEKYVRFDVLNGVCAHKIFIAATNVWTGKVRIFEHGEISVDALLASACIPELFAPVFIDGVPYWDGGFMGNPPLFPLFYGTDTADTLIVQINPIERQKTPVTAREIVNRVNEITFNASLLKELRAIRFVARLVDEGKLDPSEYKRVRMHRIASPELKPLSASSKLNGEWTFLRHVRDIGRRAAEQWLAAHFDDIGERDTIDIAREIA
ncbi:patatin-like phospholipase family protein [Acuticoccus mangrovi]|uniref:Patatin-like phospholipase family protein n=1 Tax=Acuticoccus mangrovi TaxID=2796142 RepID=A0A934MFR8_9HYPH|nr:patatin-like phospholipase family protein [Acuticoccus mangrovi]MBJ3775768.1 patatin-like phospholipase family protein [Acuticoccus mangrovi]